MAIDDPGAPISTFEFTSGAMRGSHLSLYSGCLVHRGDTGLETVPLHAIAAARVAFERDARKLGWGVALLAVALVLLALASPLASLAGGAAGEVAAQLRAEASSGGQGVAGALLAIFRFLERLAKLLPTVAFAAALGGLALFLLGWFGRTTLTLTLAAVERAYAVRGRNPMLFDFAESLSERIMLQRR